MLSSQLPTINALKQPTSLAWVEQAIANLDIILLDHAQCERKAAGVALNLMFRYPSNAKMVRELTKIAQEELEHFEQVNQWLERRERGCRQRAVPGAGVRFPAAHRGDDRAVRGKGGRGLRVVDHPARDRTEGPDTIRRVILFRI